MTRRPLRFGLHDFLNAQPLLSALRGGEKNAWLDVVLDTPSALARRLESGELDFAMIPAVAFFNRAKYYRLLEGACIASCGKVDTVLFVSNAPLESLDCIAVDRRSQTSIALLKILFGDRFSPEVTLEPFDPDLERMLQSCKAGLIIGDQAFRVPRSQKDLRVFDLSEAWFEKTGLPFVHAVIAVRKGISLEQECRESILRAPEIGLKQMDAYLATYAKKQGLDTSVCENYLKNRILYHLGKKEMEGLSQFQTLCVDKGLVAEKTAIEFY